MLNPNLGETLLLLIIRGVRQYKYGLTINPSLLPVKGGGVCCLGHAGRGVGGEVDLLGKLDDGDVVMGVFEALVVGVLHHIYCQLCETSFC